MPDIKKRGRRPTPTDHLQGPWYERLKTARRIAGLSKRELQENHALNAHTLASLEINRSVLSKEWGEQFCDALQLEKVLCTSQWLFTGEGYAPKRLEDEEATLLLQAARAKKAPPVCDEQSAITKELEVFRNGHMDNIVTIVQDDAMLPHYEFGDYVGGRRISPNNWGVMLGKNCIIEIAPQQFLIRHLGFEEQRQQYLLSAINPQSNVPRPLLYMDKIFCIAQVVLVRKLPAEEIRRHKSRNLAS